MMSRGISLRYPRDLLPDESAAERRELRKAFEGKKGASPPYWASVLLLAEKWGVPPWVLEEHASQEWFERGCIYYDVISQVNEKSTKKRGSGPPASMRNMTPTNTVGGEVDPDAGGTIIWPDDK